MVYLEVQCVPIPIPQSQTQLQAEFLFSMPSAACSWESAKRQVLAKTINPEP